MLINRNNYNGQGNSQTPNFKPRLWLFLQKTPITFIIIALNVAVYMAMCGSGVSAMTPTGTDILNWGGNLRSYTLGGDWWRLITCVFVHIGLIHIALNMITLLQLGVFLERFVGKWTFLITYLATGILASLTSLWWNGDRVSAGASGAIFGLFGFFLALLLTNLIEKSIRENLLKNIGLVIIINLGYGMKSGIDNSAHIGGLLSGIAFGFLFYFFVTQRKNMLVYAVIVLGAAVVISASYLGLHHDDIKTFQKYIGLISEQEQKALGVERRFDSLTTAQSLSQINTVALPAWEKSKQFIEKADKLQLNVKNQKVRQDLSNYLDLQIEQSNLLRDYFNGDSLLAKKQLPLLRQQIDSILKSVNKTLSQ